MTNCKHNLPEMYLMRMCKEFLRMRSSCKPDTKNDERRYLSYFFEILSYSNFDFM